MRTSTNVGTPQGSGISPVLANIYLHYVLDLWVGQWSRRHGMGTIRLVRYADDFLLMTQTKRDAEQLLAELATRFSQYGLTLHEEKTRLLAFGRYAVGNSAGGPARSGSPTFSFLGFTFYMGKSLAGYLVAKLKTQRERMISKLKVLRREMKARRHMTVAEQQQWLTCVLRGYYAYYGITGNARDIARFYLQVVRWWHWVLRRRGQRPKLPWERFNAILSRHPLPTPRIVHDWRRAVAG